MQVPGRSPAPQKHCPGRPEATCITRAEPKALWHSRASRKNSPPSRVWGQSEKGPGRGDRARQTQYHSIHITILETQWVMVAGGGHCSLPPPCPESGPSRPAQSPSPALSCPGAPTLAPAQLCSWPPPGPLQLGPRPELKPQTQQSSSAQPRPGQGWATGSSGPGKPEGAGCPPPAQGFGSLECHHQAQASCPR